MADDNFLDLIPASTLDQPIPFDTEEVLAQVDTIVERSLRESDPNIALGAGATLIKAARLSGIGLAKLLYLVEKNWKSYEVDDNFIDTATAELGLKRITIQRYTRIWKMVAEKDIPPEMTETILQRPMMDLNAIATAVDNGFQVNAEQWQRLAEAESGGEVLDIMREVKNEEPRSNTLSLKITRNGDLFAWQNGESYNIGWLDVGEAKEIQVVEDAINRILNLAHINTE